MDGFQFEAESAVVPIFGSQWDHAPEQALVYYQNDIALSLYGEWRGMLLADLLGEVLSLSKFDTQRYGHELIQQLIQSKVIRDIPGTLNGKRVILFSAIQQHADRRIQSTIINVTARFMDPLSGIPSRDLFFDRLDIELYRAIRHKEEMHICFIDLDGFKQTNDLYGHKAGDDVIVEVARRMRSIIRKHETVARFGGDEFVMLLTGPKVDAVCFAENKLIPAINEPYHCQGHVIDFIGGSIGIASAPLHGSNPDDLVNHADDAMYIAKSRGKNRAVVFQYGMEGAKKHG